MASFRFVVPFTAALCAVLAVSVIAAGCGESADPAAVSTKPVPSPVVDDEQEAASATATPTSEPNSRGGSDVPLIVSLLSVEYQEAYGLLPDGEWAKRYYATQFSEDEFGTWSEWKDIGKITPIPVATPVGPPELGAVLEFQIISILRDEEGREWLIERIRMLDESSAPRFEEAGSQEKELEVLREMFALPGVDRRALEFETVGVWQMRQTGMSEELIDIQRHHTATDHALSHLLETNPVALHIRLAELRVCNLLMWDVVVDQDTREVISGADCDVEAVTRLAREAIQLGKPIPTEAEFRERIEWEEGDGPSDRTNTQDPTETAEGNP